jgi:hypothetical protein
MASPAREAQSSSSSFITSSVKSAIRALSSSRYPTPNSLAQRNGAESLDARKLGREILSEESSSVNDNEVDLTSGDERLQNVPFSDSEALPLFSGGAIGEGEEIRSSVRQIRSVFGPDVASDLVSETAIRSLFDGQPGDQYPFRRAQMSPVGEHRMGLDWENRMSPSLTARRHSPTLFSQEPFPLFHPRVSGQPMWKLVRWVVNPCVLGGRINET